MDLKLYKDAVETAQDAATVVAARIDALMQDEKLVDALALQPELDAAEAKVQEAQKLYESMTRFVGQEESAAKNFVPVTDEQVDHQLEAKKRDEKVKTRSEFDRMNPRERMNFVKAEGKVIPDEDLDKE